LLTEDSPDSGPAHAIKQTADETDDNSEANTRPSPKLQQLTATLEDEGLAATVEDDDTLTVDRLGQTYRIQPNGSVEGDGALRSKLETIVRETT
jgi:hypothetical protein